MSKENVEIVRSVAEALNRRDVDAIVALIDADVEWHPATQALLGGQAVSYRGHDGVRQMMRDFYDAWAKIRFDISEIKEADNRVVALGRIRVRGKESGVETGSPVAYVAELKNGKVTYVRAYLDPTQALEAAGLSE